MRNHTFHLRRHNTYVVVVLMMVVSSSCVAESETKPLDLSIPKDVLVGSERKIAPELIPLLKKFHVHQLFLSTSSMQRKKFVAH
jgi:hypothetical protein